jgi:hypothetical protein
MKVNFYTPETIKNEKFGNVHIKIVFLIGYITFLVFFVAHFVNLTRFWYICS